MKVVTFDVVRWGAREFLIIESKVGEDVEMELVCTLVRGPEERAELDEVADEFALRVGECESAFLWGKFDCLPRSVGVSVPSDDGLDDSGAGGNAVIVGGATKDLFPRGVAGTTVWVEVVEREEEDEDEGVGECARGVGVDEGDWDNDLGVLAASVSA